MDNTHKNIHILDILKYLLFHWKWFAVSILLFGTYYYYQYSKSSFVYHRSETVMIKTPDNTPTSSRVSRSSVLYNIVNMETEILQLRSKELMRRTISRTGADQSYSINKRLRTTELYTQAPVRVEVKGVKDENSYGLTVIPVDKNHVQLTNFSKGDENKVLKVNLNTLVETPIGQLMVTAAPYYSQTWYGTEIHVNKYPREDMVAYFMGQLNIAQMEEDASLLDISMEDTSPKRAADIITTMITVYNEFAVDNKNKIATNTAQFIRERLAIIESELGSVELNIQELKTGNQGVDVSTAGEMYLSDRRQYQGELNKMETDLKLVEMMRDYLDDDAKVNEPVPNNTGLVDAGIEGQITAYNNTLLRKSRLTMGSSLENPVVQDMENALAASRKNIKRAVENAIAGLGVKMENLRREEVQAKGKVMQIPQKQRTMLSVARQQKVKEDLYVFLLNKREENALNQAMTEDNILIIDPASGAAGPVYPILFRKVGLGLAIGTVLPAIVLLLLLMLDTGIRGRQDIEKASSVPFIGELPFIRNRKGKTGDILVSKTGRDPLTEAFRILRTNINFMAKEGNAPKVITFSSFTTGVGKTFSVLNLATILSYLDKKVVVIDLDLRKGTLSARVGLNSGKGSSHYLSDKTVTAADVLHTSDWIENVDFIPIGLIAPNPVELLLSKRLDELIDELKDKYDYVIVDGVPFGIVADASIMNRISDLTLFIIRVGRMDRRQLPELERVYQEGKLSNLAVLLNGLKLGGYGYGSYGYGSYGYEAQKGKFSFFGKWRKS